jgi:uncharacterized membrane protein HdeD (DUF308 family)
VLVLVGALSVVAGAIAVLVPGLTLVVLGIVFGANLLVWGTLILVSAFDTELGVAHSVLQVIVGVLGALAGLVCLVRPGVGVAALLLAVSFWFILTGIADVVRAINLPQGRVLALLLGVVGIAAGVIIVSKPGIGVATLAVLAGIGFMVRGGLEVAAGLAVRRYSRSA